MDVDAQAALEADYYLRLLIEALPGPPRPEDAVVIVVG